MIRCDDIDLFPTVSLFYSLLVCFFDLFRFLLSYYVLTVISNNMQSISMTQFLAVWSFCNVTNYVVDRRMSDLAIVGIVTDFSLEFLGVRLGMTGYDSASMRYAR